MKTFLVLFVLFVPAGFSQQLPQPQGPDPVPVNDGDVLQFTHDLINTDHYELKVDNLPPITVINPAPYPGAPAGTYYCQIPALSAGIHVLILSACNGQDCLPSLPLNVRKVSGPNSAPQALQPAKQPPPPTIR